MIITDQSWRKMPKKTENYDQLLVRFNKRKEQLTKEQETFREAHEKWVELDERLSYLLGCIDTIVYLQTGKLPNDGNHDGMKHHKPRHGGDLDSL